MTTQPFPSSEQQAARGMACPLCGQQCRTGELACPACGISFNQAGRTRLIELSDSAPQPINRRLYEGLVGGLNPIAFEIAGRYLKLPVTRQVVMGRCSLTPGPQPEVDLGPFAAEEKGVSRCHVRISRQASLVYVADLGSLNGTWLNGFALAPHVERLLRDGDCLRLGRLELKAIF